MPRVVTIKDLQDKAATLGGVCLSKEYLGARVKHLWRGASGRIFELQWNFVKLGKRWDKIPRETYTIASLKEEARQRGGECLSTQYLTNKSKYSWRCSRGCEWKAAWMDVLAGSWCHWCSKRISSRKRADNLELLQKHAFLKKGRCLSDTYTNQVALYSWECDKKHSWNASWRDIKHNKSWCPECPIRTSKGERSILDFITGLGIPARSVLFRDIFENSNNPRKQLDIFVESKKVALEFCGLYWHHELRVDTKDHNNKKLECERNSIRLLTIFSDEWKYRRPQVEGFIRTVLGSYDHKVFARKCTVSEITLDTAKTFLNDNHIQGYSNSFVAYGLLHEGILLGVMTAGKHHRNSRDYVLNRFAMKSGYHVPGGASKLLTRLVEHAKTKGVNRIVSWSDNRWSQGGVYEKLNFTLEAELPPDYSYVDLKRPDKRIGKQSCKKALLAKKGGVGTTELEMAKSLGLSRIWDCGKKRWVLSC